MSTNTALPPRFREKAFRRYEEDLTLAVRKYPNTHEIDPSKYGLSAVTVAQRLRDAKRSYLDNNWSSTISRDSFMTIHEDIIVRESMNGKVKIGPFKEALEEPGTLSDVLKWQPQSTTVPEYRIVDCTLPCFDVETLMQLAHNRALICKLRVTLSESQVDTYYNLYDINLDRQEDGSYILT